MIRNMIIINIFVFALIAILNSIITLGEPPSFKTISEFEIEYELFPF